MKEYVNSNKMLSKEGKQTIIDQINILEEESHKQDRNEGKIKQAIKTIKENVPSTLYQILIGIASNYFSSLLF